MRLLLIALFAVLCTACFGDSSGERKSDREGDAVPLSGARLPTAQERREIVAEATSIHAYESDPEPYRASRLGVRLRFPRHLRPRVVRIRVSRVDPRFAAAVVELRNPRGQRMPGTEVLLLRRIPKDLADGDPPWVLVEESGTGFEIACTSATPRPVRDLSCPSAWSVLDYPRPQIRLNTIVAMRIRSPDIRSVDWKHVILPGAVCGATQPIRIKGGGGWGDAFIRSAVRPWWPAVSVGTAWNHIQYGDLDGDGREEAVLNASCSNAGGTASGQLAFASVVYAVRGHTLRSIGIITPRQPLGSEGVHAPLVFAAIRRGAVVAEERWYGPHDGSCCGSGIARTTWRYDLGRLRLARTTVLQQPWTSPLIIYDVLAEPGDRAELGGQERTKVPVTPDIRFDVMLLNGNGVTKKDVKVTLKIRQSPESIVQTKTIEQIGPWQVEPTTVSFGNFGPVQLGKSTVTIDIHDRGAHPLRYPVFFTRG